MRKRCARLIGLLLLACAAAMPAHAEEVRIKDLGHFLGWRENALVGYGVVVGLAGSGDSSRNEVTQIALKNVLSRLGANISADQVLSRNVATVIVTATLPPAANVGDRIDVTVSSVGDARSLVGGTLLMTPLLGPDQKSYALAQGPLVVGGSRFDSLYNREQKNYPASAVLPEGATVETAVKSNLVTDGGSLTFVLKDADATTAERIADAIDAVVRPGVARVRDSSAVLISAADESDVYRLVSRVEDIAITPDALDRVVVNERSGTVVAGGGVHISSVVVSQGDIRISVSAYTEPLGAASYLGGGGGRQGLRSLTVTNSRLEVDDSKDAVISFPNTTVADLVEGLSRVHVDTRGVISVLQAIKAAGALHAELIVQ